MPTVNWLTLLEAQVPLSKTFQKELERQLRDHAKMMVGVDLDDGNYALIPPDSGFEVRFRTLARDVVVPVLGYIDGYLVGPDAHGYPITIAWHSKSRPELHVTPDMDLNTVGPIEFFWAQFPLEEFRRLRQPDDSLWKAAIQPSFDMQWQIHRWPDISLQLTATDTFLPEQLDELARIVDSVIHSWNESHESKIHYRGKLEVSPDHSRVTVYIDFGSADREALPLLIRSLDQNMPPNVIARGVASSHGIPPTT